MPPKGEPATPAPAVDWGSSVDEVVSVASSSDEYPSEDVGIALAAPNLAPVGRGGNTALMRPAIEDRIVDWGRVSEGVGAAAAAAAPKAAREVELRTVVLRELERRVLDLRVDETLPSAAPACSAVEEKIVSGVACGLKRSSSADDEDTARGPAPKPGLEMEVEKESEPISRVVVSELISELTTNELLRGRLPGRFPGRFAGRAPALRVAASDDPPGAGRTPKMESTVADGVAIEDTNPSSTPPGADPDSMGATGPGAMGIGTLPGKGVALGSMEASDDANTSGAPPAGPARDTPEAGRGRGNTTGIVATGVSENPEAAPVAALAAKPAPTGTTSELSETGSTSDSAAAEELNGTGVTPTTTARIVSTGVAARSASAAEASGVGDSEGDCAFRTCNSTAPMKRAFMMR